MWCFPMQTNTGLIMRQVKGMSTVDNSSLSGIMPPLPGSRGEGEEREGRLDEHNADTDRFAMYRAYIQCIKAIPRPEKFTLYNQTTFPVDFHFFSFENDRKKINLQWARIYGEGVETRLRQVVKFIFFYLSSSSQGWRKFNEANLIAGLFIYLLPRGQGGREKRGKEKKTYLFLPHKHDKTLLLTHTHTQIVVQCALFSTH